MDHALEDGFAIADKHGIELDVCFVALLVTAADGASAIDEAESAAAMYKRATEIIDELGAQDQATYDMLALKLRATVGLGRADVDRGYLERAKKRLSSALSIASALGPSVPDVLVSEIKDEIAALGR